MGLIGRRIRPKHEILIAIDLSIQEAQKSLDEIDQDMKDAGIGPVAAGSEEYLNQKYDAFDKLGRRLLASKIKVESEMKKIKTQIDLTTGRR